MEKAISCKWKGVATLTSDKGDFKTINKRQSRVLGNYKGVSPLRRYHL